MPFCRECGTETESFHRYCRNCGAEVGTGATEIGTAGPIPQYAVSAPTYYLSPTRILLMSVLTYGLYLFYWFYLTWKHYRDHTRTEIFPVWHALALFVPIYGLFRTHAHVRSFKELMLAAGLPSTLSTGWAVVLVAISWVLDGISFNVSGGFATVQEVSQKTALAIALLDVISIAIVAGLLLQVQGNLNRYWANQGSGTLKSARIGVGEVILAVLGILAWANTLGLLLSSSYRAGF